MNKVEKLFYDEGVETGIVKGRAEPIRCIRKKLKKGYAVMEIAEVLELDDLYVKKTADLIQSRPGILMWKLRRSFSGKKGFRELPDKA